MDKKMGEWSFIIGLVIAVVIGAFSSVVPSSVEGFLILALVVLGLAVGYLNITEREATPFLVASLALLLSGTASGTLSFIPWGVGDTLSDIVLRINVFIAPAAVVVALTSIHRLAKD
jgi:uncharacterized membrane protein YccC